MLNYVCIKRYYKTVFDGRDKGDVLKILASSIIMAIVMYLINYLLSQKIDLGFLGGIIIGGVAGIAGAVCYIGSCLVLRVNILLDFIKGVRNK